METMLPQNDNFYETQVKGHQNERIVADVSDMQVKASSSPSFLLRYRKSEGGNS